MIDWNAEMKNIKGIGSKYRVGDNIVSEKTRSELKAAIFKAEERGQTVKLQELTRAYQTLMKMRNWIEYGT